MLLFILSEPRNLEAFGGLARWELSDDFFLNYFDISSVESWLAPEKRDLLGSKAWLHCKNKHNNRMKPQPAEDFQELEHVTQLLSSFIIHHFGYYVPDWWMGMALCLWWYLGFNYPSHKGQRQSGYWKPLWPIWQLRLLKFELCHTLRHVAVLKRQRPSQQVCSLWPITQMCLF